jgi:hypothetical protein
MHSQNGENLYRIVEFYRGISPDKSGRYIYDILHYNYEQLEYIHDYIQWIFPSNKPSRFNRNAPILTNKDIVEMKSDSIIRNNSIKSFKLLIDFYGFYLDEDIPAIKKGNNFNDRIKHWMTKLNHNFQRITRMLEFLELMDMGDYASLFLDELRDLYDRGYKSIIGKYTYDYWNNAVTREEASKETRAP